MVRTLEKGTALGTMLQKQSTVSNGFDCTLRNTFHPYHSNGPSMQRFNQ